MSVPVGIDLGTTNSAVAYIDGDQPRIITDSSGQNTFPSVFAVTKDGSRLVGNLAKRQMIINPENTIYAVKRLIGRRFDSEEVQEAIKKLPYRIVRGPNDDVRIELPDKIYSIQEISAAILIYLKKIAEEALQTEVHEAVITVPAYFNDNQRQATKDAGIIAGLDVLRIINEPTAAALSFGLHKKTDRATIAVYDLGGGTFDISILEMRKGNFEVLSTAGDTYLGGEDFDRRLMEYMMEKFKKETGVDLSEDKMAMQRLKEAAEKAKCDLSFTSEIEIKLPFIAMGETEPLHLNLVITREIFEDLVAALVRTTIETCAQALELAGKKPSDIDEVLLVGGQTRSPIVQREVEKFFGRRPSKNVNPDEAVALGAAVQAHALTSGGEIFLYDITPFSLGIETAGGKFARIIERNSTVPVTKTRVFTTSENDQQAVKIRVYQGDKEIAEENVFLGEFVLSGIRPAPKGVPRIEVSFHIDSDGIVNVSAKDLDTGKEQSITITSSSGLTEAEVQEMAEEAKIYELELEV